MTRSLCCCRRAIRRAAPLLAPTTAARLVEQLRAAGEVSAEEAASISAAPYPEVEPLLLELCRSASIAAFEVLRRLLSEQKEEVALSVLEREYEVRARWCESAAFLLRMCKIRASSWGTTSCPPTERYRCPARRCLEVLRLQIARGRCSEPPAALPASARSGQGPSGWPGGGSGAEAGPVSPWRAGNRQDAAGDRHRSSESFSRVPSGSAPVAHVRIPSAEEGQEKAPSQSNTVAIVFCFFASTPRTGWGRLPPLNNFTFPVSRSIQKKQTLTPELLFVTCLIFVCNCDSENVRIRALRFVCKVSVFVHFS